MSGRRGLHRSLGFPDRVRMHKRMELFCQFLLLGRSHPLCQRHSGLTMKRGCRLRRRSRLLLTQEFRAKEQNPDSQEGQRVRIAPIFKDFLEVEREN